MTGVTGLQDLLAALVRSTRRPQRDIAADVGMSEKHLSQMLTGKVEGTLTAWQAVLDAAGVALPIPVSEMGTDTTEAERIDWSVCHCGQSADGHLLGYCAHCSSVRCDAYPGECSDTTAEEEK